MSCKVKTDKSTRRLGDIDVYCKEHGFLNTALDYEDMKDIWSAHKRIGSK